MDLKIRRHIVTAAGAELTVVLDDGPVIGPAMDRVGFQARDGTGVAVLLNGGRTAAFYYQAGPSPPRGSSRFQVEVQDGPAS